MKKNKYQKLSLLVLALSLSLPQSSQAQSLSQLRQEVRELKQSVQELTNLLQSKKQSLKSTEASAKDSPSITKQWGPWKQSIPANSNLRLLPDISVNGAFSLAAFRDDPGGIGHDPGRTGFNLQEIEVAFQSIIDPYVRADLFLAFFESGVELEEAYLTTLNLPKGLQIKAGQYLLAFGRQNQKHLERWAFVNDHLVNQRLLGTEQLRELGVELSYLFPTPFFLQAQASFSQGSNGGNFDGNRKQDFAYTARLSGSTDITNNLTLLMGASAAFGYNDTGAGNATNLWGGDLLLKWRPNRRTMIEWQSEYFYRRRQVPGGTENHDGLYTYLLGQWTQRWSAGLRFGYMGLVGENEKAYRLSPMVLFRASEFFQVKAQYDYLKESGRRANHAALLQWIFTMGPHGAHFF